MAAPTSRRTSSKFSGSPRRRRRRRRIRLLNALGTLDQLAARVGGRVVGDGSVQIERIAAVDDAGPGALTFATSEQYLAAALRSKAGAVLVDEEIARTPRNGEPEKPLLAVPNARAALAQLLHAFDRPRPQGPFRHPSAVIDASALVADDVYVGANVYVGRNARIGAGTVLDVGAYVGEESTLGAQCLLYPRATVLDGCVIGDRVILHPGSVIGSEGFGYVFVEGHFERIPQVGNVVLEDDVEIGANSCVDRAQTGSTRVGRGTKIDNLCQIGHNCRIGEHSAFAALSGLAGSTIVGDYTRVGGQVGFKGHITIGSRVTIAGQSGVWGDIPDGAFVSGKPARPHKDDLRREALVRNLPKLIARVDALEGKTKRDE
ncbi:MAG: UDP-3-O-(3-hydroxymyristoyl)glucosamine N-acyltransferase [Vulcanimicrobiaceae bacterium]